MYASVRSKGALAFTGSYLVGMIPSASEFSATEHLVVHGLQVTVRWRIGVRTRRLTQHLLLFIALCDHRRGPCRQSRPCSPMDSIGESQIPISDPAASIPEDTPPPMQPPSRRCTDTVAHHLQATIPLPRRDCPDAPPSSSDHNAFPRALLERVDADQRMAFL